MSVHSTTLNEALNLNEIYLFLTDLTQRCGRIITDAYYHDKSLTDKINFADFATETDLLVEKTLIDAIRLKYPKHNFIGEESTTEQKKVIFRFAKILAKYSLIFQIKVLCVCIQKLFSQYLGSTASKHRDSWHYPHKQ